METNELYFLVMVLGGFTAFAIAMIIATLQYKAWLRQSEPQQQQTHAANRNTPPSQRHAA